MIGRINGFTRFFRLRVYDVRAVHAPRADPDDDAVEILQQTAKSDLLEERILRRDVSARKDQEIRAAHKLFRLSFVPAVQDGKPLKRKSRSLKHILRDGSVIVHFFPVVRIRANV